MRKIIVTLCFVSWIFSSCNEDKVTQPKVIYPTEDASDANSVKETRVDSTEIQIADLPIHIEGTSTLIYPVGGVRVYESKSNYSMSRINSVSYSISNYSRFELTGYLKNIHFQHKDSTNFRPLTNDIVEIHLVHYPEDYADKTKHQILVYNLSDRDTNRDGKIDSNDIKTLYLSQIDGRKFTKVSKDLHELIDWNIVSSQSRLYFRAVEDINKNGAFDKNDAVKYFYVPLQKSPWEAIEYNPLEIETIAKQKTSEITE